MGLKNQLKEIKENSKNSIRNKVLIVVGILYIIFVCVVTPIFTKG